MPRLREILRVLTFFVTILFGWLGGITLAEGATLNNCQKLQRLYPNLNQAVLESNFLLVGENHVIKTDLVRGSALLPLLACSKRTVTIVFEWPSDDQNSFDSYITGSIDQKKLWKQMKIAEYWFTSGWEKDGQYMQLLDWSKRFHFSFLGAGRQLDENDPDVKICTTQLNQIKQTSTIHTPASMFEFGCSYSNNIFRDADFSKALTNARNKTKAGLVVFYGGLNHLPVIAALIATRHQEAKMTLLDLSRWHSSSNNSNLDEMEYRNSNIFGFQILQYLKKSSVPTSSIGRINSTDVDLVRSWAASYFFD
jgi:hypothetical protein